MADLKYDKEITVLLVIDPYNEFISQGKGGGMDVRRDAMISLAFDRLHGRHVRYFKGRNSASPARKTSDGIRSNPRSRSGRWQACSLAACSHADTAIRLYLQETFTFLLLTAEAAVALE